MQWLGLIIGVCCAFALMSFVANLVRHRFLLFRDLRDLLPMLKRIRATITPKDIDGVPQTRHVTLVWIDFSDLGLMTANRSSEELFAHYENLAATLRSTVRKYGGIIERTTSEEMLAIFGYDPFPGEERRRPLSHLDAASAGFAAAIEMQRYNMETHASVASVSNALTPMRIAVHTSQCYLGFANVSHRRRMTAMGIGIIESHKLLGFCPYFSTIVSTATKDILTPIFAKDAYRDLPTYAVQNASLQVVAHEVSPFRRDDPVLARALTEIQAMLGADRFETRWPVPPARDVVMRTDFGMATIVNFSGSGICIAMNLYLARGVEVEFKFDKKQPALLAIFQELGLDPLRGVVRWSRVEADHFLLGIQFVDLSEAAGADFLRAMREFVFGEVSLPEITQKSA